MTPKPDTTTLPEILAQANAAIDQDQSARALDLLGPLEKTETSVDYLACLIEAQCLVREYGKAEASIARALALHPDAPAILHAAGLNAFHMRRFALAEERFGAALRSRPDYAKAYNNSGMNYEYMFRIDAARQAYLDAIGHQPDLAAPYKNLGRLAEQGGQIDEAREYYEQGSARTPARAEFTALLANLGHNYPVAENVQPAPPDSPDNFLALEIAQAALRHLPSDRRPAVLDLICSTGTVGALLWSRAGLMIGVDPRVLMLREAQNRNIYHDLKDQIPSDYLRGCKRGETDLIVCNGAFANVGDLLPVFLDLYAVLAPGGLLAMTFPTHQDSIGFHVEGGGSFSHDPAYVQQRADFEGMQLLERIDYTPATHPQVTRDYSLMVFAKPA